MNWCVLVSFKIHSANDTALTHTLQRLDICKLCVIRRIHHSQYMHELRTIHNSDAEMK